jgi:hypothetical protein
VDKFQEEKEKINMIKMVIRNGNKNRRASSDNEKRKTEAESYLISALRQQKRNNFSPNFCEQKKNLKKKKSYLDRCKRPMSLSFILTSCG